MAILKQSGGGPFYMTGPVYYRDGEHGPGDKKKKSGQAEAQAKADTAASTAEKVYGEPTVTQTRTTQDGMSGTLTTVSRPYTQSGAGRAIRTAEGDRAYAAKTKEQQEAQDKRFKAIQSRSGADVTTRFTPDPIAIKPKGIVPLKDVPTAPVPNITAPKKSTVPDLDLSSSSGSSIRVKTKKFEERGGKRSSGGSGSSCGCKY